MNDVATTGRGWRGGRKRGEGEGEGEARRGGEGGEGGEGRKDKEKGDRGGREEVDGTCRWDR